MKSKRNEREKALCRDLESESTHFFFATLLTIYRQPRPTPDRPRNHQTPASSVPSTHGTNTYFLRQRVLPLSHRKLIYQQPRSMEQAKNACSLSAFHSQEQWSPPPAEKWCCLCAAENGSPCWKKNAFFRVTTAGLPTAVLLLLENCFFFHHLLFRFRTRKTLT